MLVNYLNFYVHPLLRFFHKFRIFLLNINNAAASRTYEITIHKSDGNPLSAWMAEQLFKHEIHFQIEVFFHDGVDRCQPYKSYSPPPSAFQK